MVDLALFVVDDIEALPLNGKVNLYGRAFYIFDIFRTMIFSP
jgi:hypothetical protein